MENEKRLIDANALIEEALTEGAYGYVDALQIAISPTVDAVEVYGAGSASTLGAISRMIHTAGLWADLATRRNTTFAATESGKKVTSDDIQTCIYWICNHVYHWRTF